MANIARTYTFVNGQPADATQVNKNFDDIINGVGDVTTLRPTIASLGLDADLTTLALPANTTISPAGAELVNDADVAAQRATLGAAAASHTHPQSEIVGLNDDINYLSSSLHSDIDWLGSHKVETSDARLSDARPASDVSAWAKAASKPSYTAAEVGTKKITTGSFTGGGGDNVVTHGLGTTPLLVLAWVGVFLVVATSISSTTFTANGSGQFQWLAIA